MSFDLRVVVAGVAVVALWGSAAYAGDVERDMQNMQDQILQLQDQLDEQKTQIHRQKAVEEARAYSDNERGASSGLSSFFEQTDVTGWISANWNYNVEGEGGSKNIVGQNSDFGTSTDSGSFQMDQLWFAMDKDVSEDSRAGFHTDIAFGATAENFDDEPIMVYSAYASYLAPIGDGVRVDAGRLWTIVGAEVVATVDNVNISRGLVWGIQPVNNYGVLATTTTGDLTFKLGFLNDPFGNDGNGRLRDNNDNKAVAASVGYSQENWSFTTSVVQGNESDNDAVGGQDLGWSGIVDVLITWDPMEELSLVANYDYKWGRQAKDQEWHALALFGRYAINDRTGISGRYEVLYHDASTRRGMINNRIQKLEDTRHSFTITGDYLLADDLMFRGEGRWDISGMDDYYQHADGGTGDQQFVILAELIYNF